MITTIHTLATGFLRVCEPTSGVACGTAATALTAANQFTKAIRDFLGPIVLLIISGVSISFLLKREMKKFIQFAIITVMVGVFFYVPGIVPSIATSVAGLFSGN